MPLVATIFGGLLGTCVYVAMAPGADLTLQSVAGHFAVNTLIASLATLAAMRWL